MADEQNMQLHGDPETKDGYPLWSDSPAVAEFRTLILMDALRKKGVSVDQWADAIGLKSDYVKTRLRKKDATNHLNDDQVAITCGLLGIAGPEYLKQGFVMQPHVGAIYGPTDATPSRYTPEKLLEAYAMLDQGEQERVTTYISDMLELHRLERENERLMLGYEKRLDEISDTLTTAMFDEGATTDALRSAIITALQPPYLSDAGEYLSRWMFMDSSDLDQLYEEARRAVVPRGRPRKDADERSDA